MRCGTLFALLLRGGVALVRLVLSLVVLASSNASPPLPIRIMPVGDSVTVGYTDNPDWNLEFGFGYRSGLYTRLTAAGYSFQFVGASQEPWDARYGLPKKVGTPDLRALGQDRHYGYGGWGIENLAAYLPEWMNTQDPDVVLLMTGLVDLQVREPIDAGNSLSNLVRTIVNAKPEAYVIVAQLTPRDFFDEAFVAYDNFIRYTLVPSYAGEGKRVTTVDLYDDFVTADGSMDTALFATPYHPNALGYDLVAQRWFEGIQALGPITRTTRTNPEPPAASDNRIRIMPLGELTTVGYPDYLDWNAPFEFGYRSELYTRMTNAGLAFRFVGASTEPWDSRCGQPQTVGVPDLRQVGQDHHRGYYAWYNADLASYLPDWLEEDKPDVVLLLSGTVDLYYADVEYAKESLRDLLEVIVHAKPEVWLLVAQVPPLDHYVEAFTVYNEYLKNTLVPYHTNQGRHVVTVDLYHDFLAPDGSVDPNLFAAELYPRPAGYSRMAAKWFDALCALPLWDRPGDTNRSPLTLVAPPTLSPVGRFHARFAGLANQTYRVDRCDTLEGPWETGIALVTVDANGFVDLVDSCDRVASRRFYRLVRPRRAKRSTRGPRWPHRSVPDLVGLPGRHLL